MADAKLMVGAKDRLLPWVEKYRPQNITDVAHQQEVTAALTRCLEQGGGNLPHLLLYGPPGTGKTTVGLALAKQLFGPLMRERTLELNASDERGIQVIREKVKRFARTSVGSKKAEGFPCPSFKIIIMDEADAMTGDAQAALRRVIENYSRVTRFVLVCNYISRVIEPLASRCAKFRFQPIAAAAHADRLRHICNKEQLVIDDSALAEAVVLADGDLRRSITLLQSSTLLYGTDLSAAKMREVAGQVPPEAVGRLFELVRGPSLDQVLQHLKSLELDGYGAQMLAPMLDLVCESDLAELLKARCSMTLATADARLTTGVEEQLQLQWVGAELHAIIHAH